MSDGNLPHIQILLRKKHFSLVWSLCVCHMVLYSCFQPTAPYAMPDGMEVSEQKDRWCKVAWFAVLVNYVINYKCWEPNKHLYSSSRRDCSSPDTREKRDVESNKWITSPYMYPQGFILGLMEDSTK